ncbi:hypothetical protein KJ969_01845 [Patescibacteria group bacterium]|nr:hypothetical protein [Patescibacteria group bacterium]MBU1922358.1 hypothetical protein [Patescibacteria group bacterium]
MHFENRQIIIYTAMFLGTLILWIVVNRMIRYKARTWLRPASAWVIAILPTFMVYSILPILHQIMRLGLTTSAIITALIGIPFCLVLAKYAYLDKKETEIKYVRHFMAMLTIALLIFASGLCIMQILDFSKMRQVVFSLPAMSIMLLAIIMMFRHERKRPASSNHRQ